jgi:hypothetical protein
MERIAEESQKCVELWSAVLNMAIKDLMKEGRGGSVDLQFFCSVSLFLVCDVLGCDGLEVRDQVYKKEREMKKEREKLKLLQITDEREEIIKWTQQWQEWECG